MEEGRKKKDKGGGKNGGAVEGVGWSGRRH